MEVLKHGYLKKKKKQLGICSIGVPLLFFSRGQKRQESSALHIL